MTEHPVANLLHPSKHGVHGVSCSAHVFAQKQHVRRTFVRTFTTHPNPEPHPRLGDPELLPGPAAAAFIFTAPPALASVSTRLKIPLVRRPSLSLLAMIHPTPVVNEYGSASAASQSSESAAQYIIQNFNSGPRIRVVGAILHPTRT